MPSIPRTQTPTGRAGTVAPSGPATPRMPMELGKSGLEDVGDVLFQLGERMQKQEREEQLNTLQNETIKRVGEIEARAKQENLSYSETLKALETEIPQVKNELLEGVSDRVVKRQFEAIYDRHSIRRSIQIKADAAKRQSERALDAYETNSNSIVDTLGSVPFGSANYKAGFQEFERRTFQAAEAGLIDDPRQRVQEVRQSLALVRAERALANSQLSKDATAEVLKRIKDPTTPEFADLSSEARAAKLDEAGGQFRAAVNHEYTLEERRYKAFKRQRDERENRDFLIREQMIHNGNYGHADLDADRRAGVFTQPPHVRALRKMIEEDAGEEPAFRETDLPMFNELNDRALEGERIMNIATDLFNADRLNRDQFNHLLTVQNSMQKQGGRLATHDFKEANGFLEEFITGQLKSSLVALRSGETLNADVTREVVLAKQQLANMVLGRAREEDAEDQPSPMHPFAALREIMPRLMNKVQGTVTTGGPVHAQYPGGKYDYDATLRVINQKFERGSANHTQEVQAAAALRDANEAVEQMQQNVMKAISRRIE